MSENLKVLNLTPEEILQTFLAAYYDEYGETCRIGSSEYSYSTVVTYALTILLNQFNDAFKQRYLDYATGTFLDAIAATYGITERPQGYKATCLCHIGVEWEDVEYPRGSVKIKDQNGHIFENARSFNYDTQNAIPFVAIETGSEYNGIPAGKINAFDGYYSGLYNPYNTTQTSGGVDASYYEDDDHFRTWLKNEIASFAGAGTALAYRGRAMNADSRMIDAWVVQQGDALFEAGKVKIFILSEDMPSVVPLVQDACSDPTFRPICDTVYVEATVVGYFLQPAPLHVVYERRFAPVAEARNARIMAEYKACLLQKIMRPWVYAEVCKRFLEVDADGVYASEAVFVGIDAGSAAPIFPPDGATYALDLTNLDITTTYIAEG